MPHRLRRRRSSELPRQQRRRQNSHPASNDSQHNEVGEVPVEFVVRGYITGSTNTSLWTHYKAGARTYCGIDFPDGLVLKILRCLKHLCMGEAAHMDELQRAKAIPHLVDLLRTHERGSGAVSTESRNQCVNALYLLCKISRSRQETTDELLMSY